MTDAKVKKAIHVTVAACNVCPAQKSFATYLEAQAWADVHLAMHRAKGRK